MTPEAPGFFAETLDVTPARHRILLVDDHGEGADLLAELLEDLGHTVEVAREGAAALEVLQRFDADIALLDIDLPGMDGYEVAAQARNVRPHLRCIAVSGHGDRSKRERAEQLGMEAYLVKPLQLEELTRLLR